MVKRYPHSIKISYSGGSYVTGDWVAGTPTEITTECRIEPAEAGNQYKIGQSGDSISAQWEIFCPLFDGANDVPENAKVVSNSSDNPVAFRAKEHVILRLVPFQRNVSIKV